MGKCKTGICFRVQKRPDMRREISSAEAQLQALVWWLWMTISNLINPFTLWIIREKSFMVQDFCMTNCLTASLKTKTSVHTKRLFQAFLKRFHCLAGSLEQLVLKVVQRLHISFTAVPVVSQWWVGCLLLCPCARGSAFAFSFYPAALKPPVGESRRMREWLTQEVPEEKSSAISRSREFESGRSISYNMFLIISLCNANLEDKLMLNNTYLPNTKQISALLLLQALDEHQGRLTTSVLTEMCSSSCKVLPFLFSLLWAGRSLKLRANGLKKKCTHHLWYVRKVKFVTQTEVLCPASWFFALNNTIGFLQYICFLFMMSSSWRSWLVRAIWYSHFPVLTHPAITRAVF